MLQSPNNLLEIYSAFPLVCRRLGGHSLRVSHKQDWGRGFILLLPFTSPFTVLFGSDNGSDSVEPASGFVVQIGQTSCSVWCPMYGARY